MSRHRTGVAAALALGCAAPVPEGPVAHGPPEPPAALGPLLGEYEAAGDRRVLLERDGVLRLRDTAGHEVTLQAAGPDTFVASAASQSSVASVAFRRHPDGSLAVLALGDADWLPSRGLRRIGIVRGQVP